MLQTWIIIEISTNKQKGVKMSKKILKMDVEGLIENTDLNELVKILQGLKKEFPKKKYHSVYFEKNFDYSNCSSGFGGGGPYITWDLVGYEK
jgi:hypothetical protein